MKNSFVQHYILPRTDGLPILAEPRGLNLGFAQPRREFQSAIAHFFSRKTG
jgi:hypothetical protein